jgi:hypothetical protein
MISDISPLARESSLRTLRARSSTRVLQGANRPHVDLTFSRVARAVFDEIASYDKRDYRMSSAHRWRYICSVFANIATICTLPASDAERSKVSILDRRVAPRGATSRDAPHRYCAFRGAALRGSRIASLRIAANGNHRVTRLKPARRGRTGIGRSLCHSAIRGARRSSPRDGSTAPRSGCRWATALAGGGRPSPTGRCGRSR